MLTYGMIFQSKPVEYRCFLSDVNDIKPYQLVRIIPSTPLQVQSYPTKISNVKIPQSITFKNGLSFSNQAI